MSIIDICFFFFFKQKTAYEMRISDWSSDVCSSDLNRTTLVGEGRDTKGFLGCNGLKLSDEGEILSVPALRARSAQAQLSHEASIGMIDPAKLSYLMASGLSEVAARDLIVPGFLNLAPPHLPEAIHVEEIGTPSCRDSLGSD